MAQIFAFMTAQSTLTDQLAQSRPVAARCPWASRLKRCKAPRSRSVMLLEDLAAIFAECRSHSFAGCCMALCITCIGAKASAVGGICADAALRIKVMLRSKMTHGQHSAIFL
jgi:hypothetical protein